MQAGIKASRKLENGITVIIKRKEQENGEKLGKEEVEKTTAERVKGMMWEDGGIGKMPIIMWLKNGKEKREKRKKYI